MLIPGQSLRVAPAAGKFTHAIAYDLVRKGDAAVAARLHGGRPGQALLTTSGVVIDGPDAMPDLVQTRTVQAGVPFFMRITALGKPAAVALRRGLEACEQVRLEAVPCAIEGSRIEQVRLGDLWEAAAMCRGEPTFSFLTPTAFSRRGGVRLALPMPERVFGTVPHRSGLLGRWRDVESMAGASGAEIMPSASASGWDSTRIGAWPLLLKCASTDFGSWQRLRGFTGRCVFSPPARDADAHRILWALSLFAEYAGVGIWTAFGLGQVRLV